MEHADVIFRSVQPFSLIDRDRFLSIYRLLQQTRHLEGDIAEVGVYKGGTSAGMALIAPEKTLHLFESFEGFREPKFEEPHGKGEFADTSVDEVQALFGPLQQMYIHKGWFPETVTPEVEGLQFSFVHVDGAFYETTRDAISFFFPRLSEGGVMVFDDWEWVACPGVKRALLEAQQLFGFEISIGSHMQAYVRKP
jgi:O-methyltransferase